jgi:hypothetical protein
MPQSPPQPILPPSLTPVIDGIVPSLSASDLYFRVFATGASRPGSAAGGAQSQNDTRNPKDTRCIRTGVRFRPQSRAKPD